ncbi:hypothetical protein DH2020_024653 [Rehmannia glutinosa]|uniref:SB domain-containing protein n=1 Tax=Rehmannia glutinosa TaxID=99300 RepID=A0ABR0W4F6_REHGL
MLSSLLGSFKSIFYEMPIASPNPIKFIEDALFCTGPLALSYADPDKKWIIRQHLISLFQDFPFLKPSVDIFTHDDGTEVKLLNANGDLPVPRPGPAVPARRNDLHRHGGDQGEDGAEIENLSRIQIELKRRSEDIGILVRELERERESLKETTMELCDEGDRVLSWLKVYDGVGFGFPVEEAFGCLDRKSEIMVECLAADLALEDLMFAMDEAVEKGVLGFGDYMKKVRVLAREQFLHRAKMVKIETPFG